MQSKEWYNLLDYWCNKKSPRGFGLTIPFLIGATKAKGTRELLMDIDRTETEKLVVLRFCSDIWEYVLSLPNAPKSFLQNYKRFDQLAIHCDYLDKLNSIEELVDHFERYNEVISNKKFSWNKDCRDWEPFSEQQKQMIEENKKARPLNNK